ncbi:uncharacterized protein FOMMEDRAFT_162652 [Fomitiporia mediterranea MF3/22]|uniref:Uncharacterized protein n=1 Tax=Fomitiporia mediterranea (strain MF3/22) TaxID=694068 RepID=R7SJ37_FOMME|nr:uncharacterized protein FOMMEDRAFT_162652 [Fomitiporia mediterranea MF3/22]EJC97629.1 hypothetical protein FOMMEDRAFT_162652 [Fomitiporia mediterranea MF3/22]
MQEDAQRANRELSLVPPLAPLGKPLVITEGRATEAGFGETLVLGKTGMAMAGLRFNAQPPRYGGGGGNPGNQLYIVDLVGKTLKICSAPLETFRAKGPGTVIFETTKDAQQAITYEWYSRIPEVREDHYVGLSGPGSYCGGLRGGFRGGFHGGSLRGGYRGGYRGDGGGEELAVVYCDRDVVELFETTGIVELAEILCYSSRSKGGVVQFAQVVEAVTAISERHPTLRNNISKLYNNITRFNQPSSINICTVNVLYMCALTIRWHSFTPTTARGRIVALMQVEIDV